MTHLSSQAAGVALAAVLLFAAACHTEGLDYNTGPNARRLVELQTKKVVLLACGYDAHRLAAGEALDDPTGASVARYQCRRFTETLGAALPAATVSPDAVLPDTAALDINDPAAVQRTLRSLQVDAGIVMTGTYGYQAQGAILEKAVEGFTESIVPESWNEPLKVMNGPSGVEDYYLVSDAVLLGADGSVLWRFDGKAAASPKVFAGSLTEEARVFFRDVAGLDPSQQDLQAAMAPVIEQYTTYVGWLLQQDLAGSSAKNYFIDYPKEYQNLYRGMGIFPAGDDHHVPLLTDPARAAPVAPSGTETTIATARSGSWGTPFETRAMGAAFKGGFILGLLFVGAAWLSEKFDRESLVGKILELLAFGFGIGSLAMIFYFVRALF